MSKLTRSPANQYPVFLLWPGCGSFAYGRGQDHPTGLRTLDLAGFGRKLVPDLRVYVGSRPRMRVYVYACARVSLFLGARS